MDVDDNGVDDEVPPLAEAGPALHTGLPGVKVVPVPRKRYTNSDIPLATWAGHRDEYLDELIGLDGRGRFQSSCAGCRQASPAYRCKDCTHGPLWCKDCIIKNHRQSPLHIVELKQWTGLFFGRTTLKKLGLRIQLGHAPGRYCTSFVEGNKDFVVIHTNGIHTVQFEFCGCTDVPAHIQLLRISWYPATPLQPQTCATLDALRQFHFLNLQALEYMSDNTGLNPPPDRLPKWMLMVREYRHLKMLKRGGRAFDPEGVNATLPGSLAIPCRACPIPDVNLPQGWESKRGKEWLYMLILAMDANFRLRSKLRGISVDPHLSPGWSYFVNHAPYATFIADYVDQVEIGTCVGFQALLNMLMKKSKGLRATGMAAVSCARHQLFRPLGMGDLQKEERQCNMDYLFTSSITGLGLRMLTISYDVGCQWFIHFHRRMTLLPRRLHVPDTIHVRPLVPKFHLQSHEEKCHSLFSFNFMEGGARTDGEGVERNWDDLNG
ncbi:hypothetical protein FIBSPDRAFT_913099 [Athelia psychrophila]|uniref:CxC2-like cysteine cluster KDZ transposase-associated domain-containing protein n=1 Tax=Athelia psychrophila TaxID=1759441 RepID=A0A166C5Z2_9AGAM|nr:hypothetical protein FIBSPDRAFT_913099 [Fibularhizoctonia sp. CBS 109695]